MNRGSSRSIAIHSPLFAHWSAESLKYLSNVLHSSGVSASCSLSLVFRQWDRALRTDWGFSKHAMRWRATSELNSPTLLVFLFVDDRGTSIILALSSGTPKIISFLFSWLTKKVQYLPLHYLKLIIVCALALCWRLRILARHTLIRAAWLQL